MKYLSIIFILIFALSVFGQQKMSDRDVDGLKGKVKSITTVREIIESKNYADNTLKKLKDKVESYELSGTLTETIDYEYNSKDIYTIIDGDLTQKYSQLVKKETFKVGRLSSQPEPKPTQPKDERYDLKYKFKFNDKGRRIETLMYGNTGILWGKIEYKYDEKGILIEELRYSEGGDLNEQYTYKYDASGNLTETKLELHRPEKNIISFLKYSNYKLDSQGNWIEQTVTSLGEFQGKELKTVSKHSRKIEYYKLNQKASGS